MNIMSSSSGRSFSSSRTRSAYSSGSNYSVSDSDSGRSSLSWSERDARRSISLAAGETVPINIAKISSNDAPEDPTVLETINQIFGEPQCQTVLESHGFGLFLAILLVLLLFIFLYYAGPFFSFSPMFLFILFIVFLILIVGGLFYSFNSSRGPVCCR